MKTLTPESFDKLVAECVEISAGFIGPAIARQIVLHIAQELDHPSLQLEAVKVRVKNWLQQGLKLSSWIEYSPSEEFAARLVLPELFASYDAAATAVAKLAFLEAEFKEADHGDQG